MSRRKGSSCVLCASVIERLSGMTQTLSHVEIVNQKITSVKEQPSACMELRILSDGDRIVKERTLKLKK